MEQKKYRIYYIDIFLFIVVMALFYVVMDGLWSI